MRKYCVAGILMIPILLLLTGCGEAETPDPETATLCRVVFDRGHGSMWGVQFYIDVCPEEILRTCYFEAEDPDMELKEEENLPITEEQWEEIKNAVLKLEPNLEKEKKPKAKGTKKLDGGLYHNLTLVWEQGNEKQEICYKWPSCEAAEQLEDLLEELVHGL